MIFQVYGGFEIPRNSSGSIDREAKERADFWENIDLEHEGLPFACGCYIFTIGNKPWYIGMAEKQDFKSECFTPHKREIFNESLINYERGIPYLFLIAKMTPGRKFAKISDNGHNDIQALENLLIGLGLARNPEIKNIKGTKIYKEMQVPGIINTKPGQARSAAVQNLKAVFGT
jgi:hypothetical protein